MVAAETAEGSRILVAEDNKVNQMVVARALKALGVQMEFVESGREVLQALKKSTFDLILLDIQMPEMPGDEAMRQIRGSQTEYCNIPIIVLTANAMLGARETYLSDGANGYLTKPLDIKELRRLVLEVLEAPAVSQQAQAS